MKYLLMMTSDERAWDGLSPAEQERIVEEHGIFGRDLRAQKKFVYSQRLCPSTEAKTIRKTSEDDCLVTDGPFAETKEVMGGYYVIEAVSIDEAVEWAKRIPGVFVSTEVRPIWEG